MSFHVGISWKLQLEDGWMPSFSVKVEGKNTTPLESGRDFFSSTRFVRNIPIGEEEAVFFFTRFALSMKDKSVRFRVFFSFLFDVLSSAACRYVCCPRAFCSAGVQRIHPTRILKCAPGWDFYYSSAMSIFKFQTLENLKIVTQKKNLNICKSQR